MKYTINVKQGLCLLRYVKTVRLQLHLIPYRIRLFRDKGKIITTVFNVTTDHYIFLTVTTASSSSSSSSSGSDICIC